MDNNDHKEYLEQFYKICVVGNGRGYWCFSFNGNILTVRSMYENCFYFGKSKN